MKAASKRKKTNVFLNFLSFIILTIFLFPAIASAHPYSASFTNIEFNENETILEFSIDTLSILELQEDIDQNKDEILQNQEMKEEENHLVEFLTHSVILDKNNEQQEPELTQMIIEKKDNKEFLTLSLKYPPYQAGDTITVNDGLYANAPDTNYVNLLFASFNSESSQAALQGDNRSWTILLTESQQEQQAEGDQAGASYTEQDSKPTAKPTSSWLSFFKLGISHILTGYDHLLFLFALLLRKQTFKQYALIVTFFYHCPQYHVESCSIGDYGFAIKICGIRDCFEHNLCGSREYF